ncbi:MAG TPA: hypothetical protein VMF08_16955 [Candidatus Sulfotelmatobacter sp.]|nr:hypothetical protein [Candidatus Sulfotelmatobacter sp.]
MRRRLIHLFLVPAAVFLATGCASMFVGRVMTMQLKVVDAKTGRPLSGVSVVWREVEHDPVLGDFRAGPLDLASDENGVITIKRTHTKVIGYITLNRPGYAATYCAYGWGSFEVSESLLFQYSDGSFNLADPRTELALTNGYFQIPISRKDEKSAGP